MRAIYLLATIAIHLVLVLTLKLLDSFYFLFGMMVAGIIVGSMMFRAKRRSIKDLGWGLSVGSAFSFIALGSFTVWLYYNFPK